MKRILMFLFVLFLFSLSTLSGKPQHYMPLTVDITITPDKEVYFPGDIIEVNFHAYFNDEIKEKGKEYLLRNNYYKGRKLSAKMKGKRNKSIETEFAEIIETSYENTLVYFKNEDEEYRGSFKMKILTEVKNVVIVFRAFGLGEKYYDGKRRGAYLKIGGEKIYYYESKHYSKQNKKKIWPIKKLDDPLPDNYKQIEKKQTGSTLREDEFLTRFLINTENLMHWYDGDLIAVNCENTYPLYPAGSCTYLNAENYIFTATGNIEATGVIFLTTESSVVQFDIELVENYPLNGYIEFHEINNEEDEPVFNPANGEVRLYSDPETLVAQ